MLGKKMSNSSSSKGRNSLSTSHNTSASKVSLKAASTNSSASVFQQSGILQPPVYHETIPPPGITHIKTNENFKMLPRYSAALCRPHDESLPSEELDAVQLELEILLSAVALRYRNLKFEYESCDRDDKRKKGHDKSASGSSSSTKRKRDESSKKSRDNAKYSTPQMKMSKLKNVSSHSPAHSQQTDDSLGSGPYGPGGIHSVRSGATEHTSTKIMVPKNDVPNKFWLSVEPYCMPITQEDIKLLDDLIGEYKDPLVPPIPDLGSHYISRWATDDLRDEQDNSNQNAKANKRFTNSTNADVSNMIRKGGKIIGEGVTGPLTQRLLAALIEENTIPNDAHKKHGSSDTPNNGSGENSTVSNITSMLNNGVEVEKRLRKELLDLGILDASDFPKEKDDEVLNEIKRVRTELYAIAEYNRDELKSLHAAAKEEMKRLEVKRRLDLIDQEIIEIYKKVWAAKQKRRPLTKNERDDIYRLTNEQKRLSDELERMPLPGFNPAICSSSI